MSLTMAIGLQQTAISEHRRVKTETHTVVIGRSKDCDLTVSHPSLSRHHCQLTLAGDGWWVEDLGSSAGTLLNGNQIASRSVLRPLDVITCGDVSISILKIAIAVEGDPTALANTPPKMSGQKSGPTKDQDPNKLSSSRRMTVPQSTEHLLDHAAETSASSRRQVIKPQGRDKLLNTSDEPAPSASRRQRVIRPQGGGIGAELHPTQPTTVEMIIGDLNYEAHDFKHGSDFFDLSEVD